jgi:aspartyl-tRNA(Asn)/glutamyl-tRNA(Gln) amidotransferase subunit C
MTHDDIVNLGNLVNIDISEEESADIIPKMDSILGYIDQIKEVDVSGIDLEYSNTNPELRLDAPSDDAGFSDLFMGLVPNKEDGYVKVNKVLGAE